MNPARFGWPLTLAVLTASAACNAIFGFEEGTPPPDAQAGDGGTGLSGGTVGNFGGNPGKSGASAGGTKAGSSSAGGASGGSATGGSATGGNTTGGTDASGGTGGSDNGGEAGGGGSPNAGDSGKGGTQSSGGNGGNGGASGRGGASSAGTGGTTGGSAGVGGAGGTTGGTAGTGGTTAGTGGSAAGTGGTAGAGGTGGVTCGSSFDVTAGGFVRMPAMGACWYGKSFSDHDAESSSSFSTLNNDLDFSGLVEVANDANMYGTFALVGFNLKQESGSSSKGTVTPTGTGLRVTWSGTISGLRPMRVFLRAPGGETDAAKRWCAPVTGNGSSLLPYSSFNTTCWDNAGNFYAGEALERIDFTIPGVSETAYYFNIVITDVEEE